VRTLAEQAEPWPLDIAPATLIDQATLGIDEHVRRAALHSNPGPEHVFVDPVTLRFQGVIDFGDAYVSHPSFDMRRWTAPGDRVALLDGYKAESTVDSAFLGTWTAVLMGGLVAMAARWPERRGALLEDLRSLIAEL